MAPLSKKSPTLSALLGLPDEILEKIFSYVVADYEEASTNVSLGEDNFSGCDGEKKLKIARPNYLIGERSQNIDGDRRMPYFTPLAHCGNLSLKPGTLSILFVSRRIQDVVAKAFYSLYQFEIFTAESLRCMFIKHIGLTNTNHIRRLGIGLPHPVKTMPSKHLGRYVFMFERQMTLLQDLEITTTFGRWNWSATSDPNNTWIECHRGLLWMGAWITRGHPILKYLVWCEENTVFDGKLDDEIYLNMMEHKIWDNRPDVRLKIRFTKDKPGFLQVMDEPGVIEKQNEDRLTTEEQEIVLPATHILLDAYKVRHMTFKGLASNANCRPYPYQLNPSLATTTDSESSAPAESAMPDSIKYKELYFFKPLKSIAREMMPQRCQDPLYPAWMRAQMKMMGNVFAEGIMKDGVPVLPTPEPAPIVRGATDGGDSGDDGESDGGSDGGDDFKGWNSGDWPNDISSAGNGSVEAPSVDEEDEDQDDSDFQASNAPDQDEEDQDGSQDESEGWNNSRLWASAGEGEAGLADETGEDDDAEVDTPGMDSGDSVAGSEGEDVSNEKMTGFEAMAVEDDA